MQCSSEFWWFCYALAISTLRGHKRQLQLLHHTKAATLDWPMAEAGRIRGLHSQPTRPDPQESWGLDPVYAYSGLFSPAGKYDPERTQPPSTEPMVIRAHRLVNAGGREPRPQKNSTLYIVCSQTILMSWGGRLLQLEFQALVKISQRAGKAGIRRWLRQLLSLGGRASVP